METLMNPTETKATKEHQCSFCGGKIHQKEIYVKSTHKNDGDVYDWKSHKYCSDLAIRLKMYDDCDEGLTMDDFMETICSKHDDILISQLPKNELSKYDDVIRQLRCVRWSDKLGYVIRYYAKIDKGIESK